MHVNGLVEPMIWREFTVRPVVPSQLLGFKQDLILIRYSNSGNVESRSFATRERHFDRSKISRTVCDVRSEDFTAVRLGVRYA